MRQAYHYLSVMHEIDKLIAACRSILEAGKRGVVITVVGTEGSTYRRAGARAVIDEDGRTTGLVSGGCVENDLSQRVKKIGEPAIITFDATREGDLIFGYGSGCRGVLRLLVEPFDGARPPKLLEFRWNGREPVEFTTTLPDGEVLAELIRPPRALAIFGRGSDVEPLVHLAETLGWRVDRNPETVDHDAAIVMSHTFLRDVDALRKLLAAPIGYIGILGPRLRGDELLAHAGASREARIHSPVGLDLGAETPEEIALSIMAEIHAAMSRSSGRPLRELDMPIHRKSSQLATVSSQEWEAES
jgi:xanthine dehydrogenase accessory factor